MAYLENLSDKELAIALIDAIELQDLNEYIKIKNEMTRRIREE
jgi:hypothetical protein